MALIVQKYGGSSVATPELIKRIAERIVKEYKEGNKLVIVVSAMGKTTDSLIEKAKSLSNNPTPREMDMLLSVGERESIALMAIAINSIIPDLAISFTGSQIGLITDNNHQNARILEIKGERLKEALDNGKIPVIAGFQGVSIDKNITTLGRGGSDTTAIAVAAALNADYCEIYSDVHSIYSADPKLVKNPEVIDRIDYDTLLEITTAGAKVLKEDAVEYAKRLNVKIRTASSFTGEKGSIITNETLNKDTIKSIVLNEKLYYTKIQSKDFNPLFNIPYLKYMTVNENQSIYIFDEKFINHFKDFEIKQCSSISIIGSGVMSDISRLKSIIDLIREYTSKIIAFQFSNIKYDIFLEGKGYTNIIEDIHSLLFKK